MNAADRIFPGAAELMFLLGAVQDMERRNGNGKNFPITCADFQALFLQLS